MKKILVVISLVVFAVSLSAQNTTLNDLSIKFGDFTSTLIFKNTSLITDITLHPIENETMKKLYGQENWGTIFQKENFSPSVSSNVCLFWYIHRISKLETIKAAGEAGEEEVLSMPQKDNEAKLILLYAEFIDPVSGVLVKKIIQVEAMPSDAGVMEPVKSKFTAIINNEVLGLNTLKFVCENEIKNRVELTNEELGLKIVLKNEKEKVVLAPNLVLDGLYQFEARVETDLDIPPIRMKVELFIEDGKMSFSKNAVNSFFLEDKEKVFEEEIVNVRFRNTRSEPITIYIPKRCISEKTGNNRAAAVEVSSGNSEYYAFTLQQNQTKILKLKSGLIRTVVYNGRSSKIFNISVMEKFCNARY